MRIKIAADGSRKEVELEIDGEHDLEFWHDLKKSLFTSEVISDISKMVQTKILTEAQARIIAENQL